MQSKSLLGFLAVLVAALSVGLILLWQKSANERASATANLVSFSNQVVSLSNQLGEQRKVNDTLEGSLSQRVAELGAVSNQLQRTESTLTVKQAEAEAAARAAAEEIGRRDKQIAGLEGEREDLTKRMGSLNKEIDTLAEQITDTQRKLQASEGDRVQLMAQLRRLQAEKAELEKKFQDLAVLRDQVKKLKEELSLARRVEFIRKGLYGFNEKGGQLLQRGLRPSTTAKPMETAGDVQVELDTKGGAQVSVPGGATNAPQAK